MKKSLHLYIDPSLLPKEYDGQLDSIDGEMNKSFIKWTQERNDYMIQFEQYGIDLKQVLQLLQNIRKEHDI